jgi:hypothetical protein
MNTTGEEEKFGKPSRRTPPRSSADDSGKVRPRTSEQFRLQPIECEKVIVEICGLRWRNLTKEELVDVAWAYYSYSVQFRENLEIACRLYPDDLKLRQLKLEECDTDNLSPWPGVTRLGEKINHDEFMRRLLTLSPIDRQRQRRLQEIGQRHLSKVREIDMIVRAASIASYEDGGLERVFRAFLQAQSWDAPLLQGFKHFLIEHIRFDNDPERGHGALSRHLGLDDEILPLWTAFKYLLIESAPSLISSIS